MIQSMLKMLYASGDQMGNNLRCSFKKEFLRNATILYVEDNDEIRNEAIEIFDGFFKNVISAVDGVDGLEKFNKHHADIDIILTDIDMPRMSGLDLLSEIRDIDWNIPVLITTGFEKSDILIKLIKFNVTNYIVKPMQLNTTFKIISLLLEEKERKRDVKRQENELKQFMSILDSINLVCEINLDGTISYANDFVNDLPLKSKTVLGDSGIRLSGGQRQRITIARAFLQNQLRKF